MKRKLIPAVVLADLLLSVAFAQNVTSSLLGTVLDPSGAPIPGATCTLTHKATGSVFSATTAIDGGFNYALLPLGSYTLEVRREGMKSFSMSDIVLTAAEVRTIGRITLQIGTTTEVINVTADATPVQTRSAERTGLISGQQLNDIAIRGRDFLALLSTVPGVVDTSLGGREVPDPLGGHGNVSVQGASGGSKNIAVDGILSMDVGNNSGLHFVMSMDAIAEVKILTSGYQAEHGRNLSTVSVITKSGTREFHAEAYTYLRNEAFNANSFFNNRGKTPRPIYRYRISGYQFGGPIYIPNKFNADRDKLFVFFTQELISSKQNWGTYRSWMPTAMERVGDFSNSRDVNGSLFTIKDPLTGQPFAGNVIPSDRVNKYGKAILAITPNPNYTDTSPGNLYRYNYQTSLSTNYPRHQEVLRTDYNPTSTIRTFFRHVHYTDSKKLPYGNWMVGAQNFPLYTGLAELPSWGNVGSFTKIFSPTLVADVTFGVNQNKVLSEPVDLAELSRSRMAGIPELFADSRNSNKEPGLIPNVTFGGIPANPVNMDKYAIPYRNMNRNLETLANVSKTAGRHMLKFGGMYEYLWKGDPTADAYYGAFNFSRDTNNPFDTGHSYANALAGVFTNYSEDIDRDRADTRSWLVDLYAQDNWRVNDRLTLDIGLRMGYWAPGVENKIIPHTLLMRLYDPAKMPAMYRPAFDPSGRRVAQDPRSGAFAPQPMIGMFVPGTGDPFAGIVPAGTNGVPKTITTLSNPNWAPRFGFAYDVFGNGNTAIRGSFGVFKDRSAMNAYMGVGRNPPNFYKVQSFYGFLDTFAQAGGAISPTKPWSEIGEFKVTSAMNFNLNIQHQIRGTVIDVAYVGMLSRHLQGGAFQLNEIPMYSRFDPKNQDPTRPGKPLPDDFFRPYPGYVRISDGGIYNGSSNYNSLQAQASRRFSKGLQFGLAYTFSKALAYNGTNPYFPIRYWNYGVPGQDRPHVFKGTYIYELPKIGSRMGSKALGWLLDNWSMSGMVTMQTGGPFTPGFSTTDGEDITGSAFGPRITVTGNPEISKSEKTFSRNFNTEVFQRTPTRGWGNASSYGLLYAPGLNNIDTSLTKRFPLFSEGRYVQLRWETFNTLNHTQFTGVNSTARFDKAGKQVDSTFGQATASANPRIMQLSLRIVF